jgi:hypothetical protein
MFLIFKHYTHKSKQVAYMLMNIKAKAVHIDILHNLFVKDLNFKYSTEASSLQFKYQNFKSSPVVF